MQVQPGSQWGLHHGQEAPWWAALMLGKPVGAGPGGAGQLGLAPLRRVRLVWQQPAA
jgi:hypothetical protein